MTTHALSAFVRDRFTWLAYFMLAYYGYLQSSLGPLMPFLRAELDLNYTVGALHLSAFALGMIIAGGTGERAAARLGRRRLFWLSGAGMAAGMLMLIALRHPILTITAALIMGTVGSYLLVMVQAGLADHHGALRALPLTEANVIAMIASTCAPLFISTAEGIGIGWRAALLIGGAWWMAQYAVNRHVSIPDSANAQESSSSAAAAQRGSAALPMRFWLFWMVVVFGVAIEWAIAFWGADFLHTAAGLDRVTASGIMSLYFFAMLIGRFVGSRLARTLPAPRLLYAAVGLVIVGFPPLWLGQSAPIQIAGLFVTGLGVANLFPLTLSLATGVDPAQANKASARVAMGAGVAILAAPQILGALADQVGIFGAFGAAAVLIGGALVMTVWANREEKAL
ncbi:MAG: MFS transporter [bacterium]|nr:MFS transporter [bacterium]